MVAPADLVFSMLADELVVRVVDLLHPHGIEVMVLKGALWQHTLYERPGERTFTDVDLLVVPERFATAISVLAGAGFYAHDNPQGDHEQALSQPGMRLSVDVHRSLFAHGRFRLRTSGVFARSRLAPSLFGRPVRIPDPLDQLAHLIGHHASEHAPPYEQRREDLARLIRGHGLDARQAAAHLEQYGLRRAAFFTLSELSNPESRAFVDTCLSALPQDPLGRALAGLVGKVVRGGASNGPLAIACAQTLNTSLWQAGVSGFESALRVVQRKLRGSKGRLA